MGYDPGETVVIYARDIPSGVNAHISGDAIGISAGGSQEINNAGGWGITREKQMITKDWSL